MSLHRMLVPVQYREYEYGLLPYRAIPSLEKLDGGGGGGAGGTEILKNIFLDRRKPAQQHWL